MFRKISLVVSFSTILIISLLFPTQKASALYINVTPKTQTISNGVATVDWEVGWGGGQSQYTLAFRSDSDKGYRTLVAQTDGTYQSVSQKYDLGEAESKTWRTSFMVIDYWGLFTVEEVSVNHNRIDREEVYKRPSRLLLN